MTKFEGRDVIGTKIAITNAGDGLSAAMAIEPEEHKLGSTVYVVIECTVTRASFEEVKDAPRQLQRVERLKAGVATIVGEELVKDVLEEQRLAIEQAAGITRLDFVGDEETG